MATRLDLDQWCAGTLPHLDAFTGSLKDLLGVDPGFSVTYFVFPPPLRDADACRAHAQGCALPWHGGGAVASEVLPHEHEIVHAVGLADGQLPHVLEEGTASYWGDLMRQSSTAFERGDFRDALDAHWSGDASVREYAAAAEFTGFLVDTYGVDAYLELRSASSDGQSREEFERAFEMVFGVPFADALVQYEQQWAPCAPSPLRRPFFECSRPGTPVVTSVDDTEGVLFDVDLSCSNPSTVGPRAGPAGPNRMWQDIVVDLDHTHDGTHLIDFEIDDPAIPPLTSIQLEVRSCDRSCIAPGVQAYFPEPEYNFPDPDPNEFEAPSGRYVLRVSRGPDDPEHVRFRWR